MLLVSALLLFWLACGYVVVGDFEGKLQIDEKAN